MSSGAGVRDLVVDTMTSRLVGVPATAAAHHWLDATSSAVAHEHLPRALSAAALPAGHWFLPRLDLALSCPGLGGLPPLADDWSRAIVDSITASLAADAEWVHFATDTDLVAAMVVSAVTGDTARDWAWVEAGLPEEAVRSHAATDTVAAALKLHPDVAAPALVRAARTCGVAALDHALGESGWSAVADALGVRLPPVGDPPAVTGSRGSAGEVDEPRAAALLATSPFGRLVLGSRLRPTHATATVWASLVVAEVEPGRLTAAARPHLDVVCDLIETRLATRDTAPADATRRPRPTTGDDDTAGEPARQRAGTPDAPARESRAPDPHPSGDHALPGAAPKARMDQDRGPEPAVEGPEGMPPAEDPARRRPQRGAEADDDPALPGLRTEWAGLTYLLATAHASGLPTCVDADPALAGRGVRWSVWRAGIALTHARVDDPAVLALCGLAPEHATFVLDQPPGAPDELRAVARLAARWRRVTLDRLRSAPYGVDAVPAPAAAAWTWLVGRPGEVLATPGWIDVVLPLRAVDAAVRSAGPRPRPRVRPVARRRRGAAL